MRKLFTILALLAITFQCIRNVVVISSFYINQEYIAKNICINRFDKIPLCKGSCYLEKQLNGTKDKSPKQHYLKLNEYAHFYQDSSFQIAVNSIIKPLEKSYFSFSNGHYFELSYSIDHPPCA